MKDMSPLFRRIRPRLCGTAAILIVLGAAAMAATNTANAAVDVTGSTGANGSYATLKAAFDAVNANATQTGKNITLTISTDTDEGAASAVLNAGNWTTLRVQPTGARTIAGATVAGSPLIGLNGADRVTIDGLNTGGNSLTISNTTVSATAGTSTIRLLNGAQNNTITNCAILGSSTTAVYPSVVPGGNVLIGTSTGAANSGNIISNNNIGPAGANLPSKGVASFGSPGFTNRDNVITNNNVFDVFGGNSAGIHLYDFTQRTTVSNNRIYQTAPRASDGRYFGILMFAQADRAGAATITGNKIGFGAANGTGTTTISGSANRINGIAVLRAGALDPTVIQANTVSGFSQTTSVSGVNENSPFVGIATGINSSSSTNGLFEIRGNTIGSLDGSSGIAINNASTLEFNWSCVGVLIRDDASGTTNVVANNNIGTITIDGGGGGSTGGFRGIQLSTFQDVTVTDNTIAGITNNIVGTYEMYGIVIGSGNTTATGNVVRNMIGNSNGGAVEYRGIPMSGIIVFFSPSGATTISQNTVHSLSNNPGAASTFLYGIACDFGTNAGNVVERNLVHSLSVNSSNLTNQVAGIVAFAGTASYKNNMVRLGIDAAGANITGGYAIYGMFEQDNTATAGTPPTISRIFANTVYVGGSSVASSSNTFAFLSNVTSGTRAYQDNILWNARSNASGVAKNYAIGLSGTGFTSNFNDLFASGTGGAVGAFDGVAQTSLANWQSATGQDGMSISANPLLVNPTGNVTTLDLHLGCGSPAAGAGTALAGVMDDYDGDPRHASTPDVGADEIASPDLCNLTLSATAFTFSPGTTSYQLYVRNATTSTTVTPTAADSNSSVTVNGMPVPSGTASASIPLNIGENTITVVITPESGPTTTYTLVITRAAAGIEDWRVQYFGTTANSGAAANAANPDGDRDTNFAEFAFGTNPTVSDSQAVSFTAPGTVIPGSPIVYIKPAPNPGFFALYSRRADYVAAGLTYTVEFSADLASWFASTDTPAIEADNGTVQAVSVPYPSTVNGQPARFFRVVVTMTP